MNRRKSPFDTPAKALPVTPLRERPPKCGKGGLYARVSHTAAHNTRSPAATATGPRGFPGTQSIYCLTLPCGGGRVRPWPTGHERRAAGYESRFPAVCRRLPFWQFPQPARLGRARRLSAQPLFLWIPSPLARKLCTTAYAHPSMYKTIKFESKSIKKATFSVKKASKRRAFRHAHLNILGGHPLWR